MNATHDQPLATKSDLNVTLIRVAMLLVIQAVVSTAIMAWMLAAFM